MILKCNTNVQECCFLFVFDTYRQIWTGNTGTAGRRCDQTMKKIIATNHLFLPQIQLFWKKRQKKISSCCRDEFIILLTLCRARPWRSSWQGWCRWWRRRRGGGWARGWRSCSARWWRCWGGGGLCPLQLFWVVWYECRTDRRIGWKGESRYNAFSPENLVWNIVLACFTFYIMISILMYNLQCIGYYIHTKSSDWN